MSQGTRISMLLGIVVLAIVLGVNLAPDVRAVQTKAFGAAPLGVQVLVVVSLAEVILAMPMFWALFHFCRIGEQARRDGEMYTTWYLYRVVRRHPELRRSQLICVAAVVYCLVIVGAWIIYAEVLGI